MKFTIGITGNELAILALCAAKQDVRYYLNGIHVEVGPEGGRAVSTDGHRLMVCAIPTEHCTGSGTAILPAEFVTQLIRNTTRSDPFYTYRHQIRFDSGTVTARIKGGAELAVRAIDGKFPDWRRVVPAKANGERSYTRFDGKETTYIEYAGQYLADFDTAAGLISRNSKAVYELTPNGSSGALVSIGDDARFIGVLMPRNAGHALHSGEAPSWVHADVTGTEEKAAA